MVKKNAYQPLDLWGGGGVWLGGVWWGGAHPTTPQPHPQTMHSSTPGAPKPKPSRWACPPRREKGPSPSPTQPVPSLCGYLRAKCPVIDSHSKPAEQKTWVCLFVRVPVCEVGFKRTEREPDHFGGAQPNNNTHTHMQHFRWQILAEDAKGRH